MNGRKRRVARQRLILMIIVTIGLFLAGVLVGSHFGIPSESLASESTTTYKYYTSIEIEKGDSLWSIANQYMSEEYKDADAYIQEVVQLNHLKTNQIHAGEYLTIPYYSTEFVKNQWKE